MLVSGSVENTYLLFGFNLSSALNRKDRRKEWVEVQAIESTTVIP